jgi:hypothetical protein
MEGQIVAVLGNDVKRPNVSCERNLVSGENAE